MHKSVPNWLTMGRVAAIPLIIAGFYLPMPWAAWIAAILFTAASITDFLDGYLARKHNIQSDFGRFLDPVADKLLVGVCLMLLVWRDVAHLIPAVIILSREILVSGLREFLAGSQVAMPVTQLAKWKTGIQMGAIGWLLFTGAILWQPYATWAIWLGNAGLWAAAALTVITGYGYLRSGLRHMHDA